MNEFVTTTTGVMIILLTGVFVFNTETTFLNIIFTMFMVFLGISLIKMN